MVTLNKHQNDKKRVLIIAHEFPPVCGGLVMRALKFAKYLPEYGWHPIILTANPNDCYGNQAWGYDPGLLTEIEDEAIVCRIPSPLERKAQLLWGENPGKANASSAQLGSGSVSSREQRGPLVTLGKLHTPQDERGLWIPYAFKVALRLINSEKIDAILTTSPPHLVHLTGYWLKRRTRLPWVVDFRDGWVDNPIFRAESQVRQRLDRWLEGIIVRRSDIKLVVTKYMLFDFRQRYPEQADSFRLVRNGFDPMDFQLTRSSASEHPISFVHVGNLGGFRDPTFFLQAFQELFAERVLDSKGIQVRFIGKFFNDTRYTLPEWVTLIPPVSHREAIRQMIHAGVLVMVAGMEEGESAFTSKVFEYLAAQRPILAIVPSSGELADLLSSYSLGLVASPDNLERIKHGILQARELALNKLELHEHDFDLISQFDRRLQTKQLAQILNALVTEGDSFE
jgi:glycosyltransferase involved in cell wall biosynthesis